MKQDYCERSHARGSGVLGAIQIMLAGLILTVAVAVADAGRPLGFLRPERFTEIPDYGLAGRALEIPREDCAYLWYLGRFPDGQNVGEFEVVDSVLSRMAPSPCGSTELAYLDQRDSALTLVTLNVSEADSRDTVAMWDIPGERTTFLSQFYYRSDDSLLIFTLSESTGHTSPWQTYVTRVVNHSALDTIIHLDGYKNPTLSPDGTEVFLQLVYAADTSQQWSYNIAVFDMLADSLLAPVESSYNAYYPFRTNRLAPLYYIKVDSLGGNNVWRWSSETGEQQVSQFELPQRVSRYYLGDDKLVAHVTLQGGEARDVEEVVIDLSPINE